MIQVTLPMKKEHAHVLGFLVKTAVFGLAAYTISHLHIYTQGEIDAEPDINKKAAMQGHNLSEEFFPAMDTHIEEAHGTRVATAHAQSRASDRKTFLDRQAAAIDGHTH